MYNIIENGQKKATIEGSISVGGFFANYIVIDGWAKDYVISEICLYSHV